ncbi:MAG: hypothetical protein RJA22_124, partial [Verrucomicrobiota bacterium]
AGPYTLVVSNGAGTATSAPGLLTVLTPPVISVQPVDQTVSPGTDVVFTVVAAGAAPFTYQWRLNGAVLAGATNATLLLTNVGSAQVGAYDVEVSSASGTTRSQPARLTLTGLVLRPTLFIEGVVGAGYRIEYRDGVSQTNWLTLTNLTLGTTPYQFVDYSAQGRPQRLYRVIAQ